MPIKIGRQTFYTTGEIQQLFGVTRVTIRKAIKKGRLKAIDLGRKPLIEEKDLKRFLEESYRRNMVRRTKKLKRKKGEGDQVSIP